MTTDGDQLAAVLDEIAEMERREGFEGPKISTDINAARELIERSSIRLTDENGITWSCELPSEWIEDIVGGEIVRAAKAHRNPENRLEDWMIDIEDGGDGQFVVYIKDRLGHKLGVGQGPLAIAAATAYRDALKGYLSRLRRRVHDAAELLVRSMGVD